MTILNVFRNVSSGISRIGLLCLAITMIICNGLLAQCPQSLGCNDNIQISLDYDCFAVIRPELILEDEKEDCLYKVTIRDQDDRIVARTQIDPISGDPIYPAIDGSFIGKIWKAEVSATDEFGITISCWGYFTVEDKLPPEITCLDDITVDCSEDLSELYTSMSTMRFCSENDPADMDANPDTKTICLVSGNMANPWEIIESVLISGPVSGSGSGLLSPATGSGSIKIAGISYRFSIDPVTGQISGSELEGVQTNDDNIEPKIMLTVDASNDLSDGICIDLNSSSFIKYQRFDNCDPSTEVVVTRDEIEDLQCGESSMFTARRDITYFTKDNAGLSAQPCDFSIFFKKKSLLDLEFPDNVKFDCDDPVIFNDEGQLDVGPAVAGYPLLDGEPLTDENNLCRINVTFTDDTFNLCGANTIKILRRWTALDWCEGQYSQAYQSIKVHDVDGPEVICPDGFLIYEADGDCTADIIFRPLDQSDTTGVEFIRECSGYRVTVQYRESDLEFVNAIARGNNTFEVPNLPYGFHDIKYIFTDDCGNESECVFPIRVIDDAAPIPVCDEFTAVTLADNGWARAYSQTFDDGSYDDCGGPITFQVRRPDLHCAPYDSIYNNFGILEAISDTLYRDYVEFCCEDAGQTVDVILRVTDAGGRHNTCRVKVQVQDKTPFTIISCPPPVWELDCGQDIDTSRLGVPVIEDNCATASLFYEDSGDISASCGNGTIIRSWFVEVNGQIQELGQCQQIINIRNRDPLHYLDFDWPAVERTDATCMNFTTDLGDTVRYRGVPVNEAELCGILAYSFKDKVFRDVEGYCLKIIRTWTVVDWCIYDPNSGVDDGRWTHTQIIKVSSQDGPLLSNCSRDTTLFITDGNCQASVFLEAPEAFDPCFNEDINPNRIAYVLKDVKADTIVAQGNGNLLPTVLSQGSYRITWSASGVCGVESTCSSFIDVVDGKAPSPYCKSGITTVLMPAGVGNQEPQIEIWAVDFDLNSFDNCDQDLEFSFSPDAIVPAITFTCDDLGLQGLDVYVIDDAGNKDFCHTAINIQANNDICPIDSSGMMMAIAGDIKLENNIRLQGVEVMMENMDAGHMLYNKTNDNGHFAFANVLAHQDYRLQARHNADPLNGVSTLDLIFIQRHILGIDALDSPYKLIAADINNNREISAIDLIELRKLILGIYEEFPQNESWRFLKGTQSFADPENPWPFEEKIDIHDLSSDMMDNDFVGVKIGDVNGSVIPSKNNGGDMSTVVLNYDILEITDNYKYLIPFYMDQPLAVTGIQAAIGFDGSQVKIEGIESGRFNINYNQYRIDGNRVVFSWHDVEPVMVSEEEALFYITVESEGRLNPNDIYIDMKGPVSEVYNDALEPMLLSIERDPAGGRNILYQNVPNPFSHNSEIAFELERATEATLTIVDAQGRIAWSITDKFKAGMNSITINSSDLNGNGIYYFRLDTGTFTATRKMILIE